MRLASPRLPVAALAASFAVLGGCGGDDRRSALGVTPPVAQGPAPAATSVTDGRLGPATTARDGEAAVLDRGGRIPARAAIPPRGAREGVDGTAGCGTTDAEPTAESLDATAAVTVCLVNLERSARGLAPLVPNARLTEAALAHAQDMIARGFFAHESPTGSTPTARIRATGYIPTDRSWTVGENLAWGSGALATPASIARAWMASPGHRDNILKPAYREIGIAVVAGVPRAGVVGGATYATTFGGIEGVDPAVLASAAAAVPSAARGTSSAPAAATAAARRSAAARRARARAAPRGAPGSRRSPHPRRPPRCGDPPRPHRAARRGPRRARVVIGLAVG